MSTISELKAEIAKLDGQIAALKKQAAEESGPQAIVAKTELPVVEQNRAILAQELEGLENPN